VRGCLADSAQCAAVTSLVNAGAWDVARAAEPSTEAEADELDRLARKGFVVKRGGVGDPPKYHFTPLGVKSVGVATQVLKSIQVAVPRPLQPLQDCSVFELIRSLENAGWDWKPMPPPKKRGDLHFDLREPEPQLLLWYGSPRKSYLRAFLGDKFELRSRPPRFEIGGCFAPVGIALPFRPADRNSTNLPHVGWRGFLKGLRKAQPHRPSNG
jgi:hypothetical protein